MTFVPVAERFAVTTILSNGQTLCENKTNLILFCMLICMALKLVDIIIDCELHRLIQNAR